jgi:antirestriction protein ArdC
MDVNVTPIVASLEKGVRPWMKPWSGEHAAGTITRPLRHNGTPYSCVNILMLWGRFTRTRFWFADLDGIQPGAGTEGPRFAFKPDRLG